MGRSPAELNELEEQRSEARSVAEILGYENLDERSDDDLIASLEIDGFVWHQHCWNADPDGTLRGALAELNNWRSGAPAVRSVVTRVDDLPLFRQE
jgi:hypothetical protein